MDDDDDDETITVSSQQPVADRLSIIKSKSHLFP